jgi:cellulose biosynthesis protein BcsQ
MTNYLIPDDVSYDSLKTLYEVEKESCTLKEAILSTRYEGLDFIASKSKVRKVEKNLSGENLSNWFDKRMFWTEEDESGKQVTRHFSELYDVILYDVAAGTSNLNTCAYLSSDVVVMPVIPDVNSIEDCDLTLEIIKEEGDKFNNTQFPEIKILRNRFKKENKRGMVKEIATRDAEKALIDDHFDRLLDIKIPEKQAVLNCVNEGVSFFEEVKVPSELKLSIEELANYMSPLKEIQKELLQ